MVEQVVYEGIKIDATDEFGEIEVFFSNAFGNFEPLHNVGTLKGFKSFEEAIEAGKKFVDEHQWQYVNSVKNFRIYVRCWWSGDWGYRVKYSRYSKSISNANFVSREKAIDAAIALSLSLNKESMLKF